MSASKSFKQMGAASLGQWAELSHSSDTLTPGRGGFVHDLWVALSVSGDQGMWL